MRHLALTYRDLRDQDGRTIPFEVQLYAYLIWTAPERGLTMRDYRKIFRRVGKMFGHRIGFWTALKFTRNTPRFNRVSRSWVRSEYYLDDAQIEWRQSIVFRRGLRGTGFDKMDRIRMHVYDEVPYRKMGQETCLREPLFGEITSIDTSMMPKYDQEETRTLPGLNLHMRSISL